MTQLFQESSPRVENTSNVSHTSFTLIKISFKKCLVPQTSKLIFQLLKQKNFHQVKHVCKKISKVKNFFVFLKTKKIFLTETSQMCLRYYCLFWENPIIFWLPLGFVWRKCQLLSEFSDSTGLDRCASQSRWKGTRGFHLISSQPFTVTAQSLHYVWLLKIYTLLSIHCVPSHPILSCHDHRYLGGASFWASEGAASSRFPSSQRVHARWRSVWR